MEWHCNRCFTEHSSPALSVVFPTYQRPRALMRTLDAVRRQWGPGACFELIVCDDASADQTIAILEVAGRHEVFPLAWCSLSCHGGPARARNCAMCMARAPVVLFLGDDIVPETSMIQRHIQWHAAQSALEEALLGCTTWPDEMEATPFMKFLEDRGRAFFFAYRDLPAQEPISGVFFYTCNVSLKRALFERVGGFHEGFPFASHEDLELGMRLERAGMKLFYDPETIGYHWHRLDLEDTIRRVYRNGVSSVRFWAEIGQSGALPIRMARRFLSGLCGAAPTRAAIFRTAPCLRRYPACWLPLLHAVYWVGHADGRRNRTDARFMEFRFDSGDHPLPEAQK